MDAILERADCNLTGSDEEGNNLVHQLVQSKHHTYLHRLLQLSDVKPMINQQNVLGATPLAMAVVFGLPEIVDTLLSDGADPKETCLPFFVKF